ncbi:MAG: TetR/AcrR family transcriptional regulator [Bacteriovoracia bacterium]
MMEQALSRKGQERREQILNAAVHEFTKQGYAHTTLKSVALRARVQPSLVLYHFESVEAIFVEIVRREVLTGQQTAVDYVTRAKPGLDALLAMIDAMFDWIGNHRERQSLMCQFYALTFHNRVLQRLNAEIALTGRRRIQGIIEQGQASGQFGRGDAGALADVIQALITGMVLRVGTDPEGSDPRTLRQSVLAATRAWVPIARQ